MRRANPNPNPDPDPDHNHNPDPNPNPNPSPTLSPTPNQVRVALLQAAARSGGTKQSVTLVVELGSWLEVTAYSNPTVLGLLTAHSNPRLMARVVTL